MSEDFRAWIGRETSHSDTLNPAAVEAMAATLDLPNAPAAGDALPPGWPWLFFNPAAPRSGLGVDGHPARGGFLPPIELPRRMWAGSRIRYLANLPVGAQAQRHSRIANIVNKTGKRGALWFVTVEHTTVADGTPCIVEEQDIVYREAPPPSANHEPPPPYEETAQWSQPFTPDTTLLFRYSALTFNGHRIHYDQTYARNEEGYPDLVVHGPLTATLLQQLALKSATASRWSALISVASRPCLSTGLFAWKASPPRMAACSFGPAARKVNWPCLQRRASDKAFH